MRSMCKIYFRCAWCRRPGRRSRFVHTWVCSSGCWHQAVRQNDPDYDKRVEARRRWAQELDDPWSYGVRITRGLEY